MSTVHALVIDASAVVDLLQTGARAESVRAAIRDAVLHAPDCVDMEVSSALARWERAGAVDATQATAALELHGRMALTRHASLPLMGAAWGSRQNVRVADGLYAHLAATLGLPLLTCDGRLARAVRQQRWCEVLLIE